MTNANDPVPIGTRVLYHDRVHVVRGYNDLDRRSDLTGDVKALHYPDGFGYELWPQDVPFKFGCRDQATYYVRRASFTVLGEGGNQDA